MKPPFTTVRNPRIERAVHYAALAGEVWDAVGGGVVLVARPLAGRGGAILADLSVQGASSAAAGRVASEMQRAVLPMDAFTRPEAPATRGFVELSEDAPLSLARHLRGVGRQLVRLVFDEGELATWIAVIEVPEAPRLPQSSRRLLSRARCALEVEVEDPADGRQGYLVLDRAGRVLHHSAALTRFAASPALRAALGPALREVEEPFELAILGAHLTFEPLAGGDGTWLAEVAPPQPIMRAPDSLLTPTQRRVAEYAAAGATCQEIAKTLEASKETVRTHLREIYRRLEVSCRAELAQRVRAA